jgi:hypothetical protein
MIELKNMKELETITITIEGESYRVTKLTRERTPEEILREKELNGEKPLFDNI